MQISGISSSPFLPLEKKTNSSPVSKPVVDQAIMNFSADSFSDLVKEAGQFPEVRSELVDAYKSRIQSGEYPSQETIAGLANYLGNSLVQMAKAASSSK